jgi:hypothetical protein
MAQKIPPEALAYLRDLGKKFGSLGGKAAAKNMTPEERRGHHINLCKAPIARQGDLAC